MKRYPLTHAALGVLIAISAFGLSACDFQAAEDAASKFKIIIGLEKQKTTVGVEFIDAATGALIPSTFDVKLTGPDAATIVDSYGDPLTKRTAKSGLVGFSIANAKLPTSSSPVAVSISASPEGYLPVEERVVISDTGAVSVRMRAMRLSAPAQGTQVAQQQTTTSSAGVTQAPAVIATPTVAPPSGGQPPPQASVEEPAGLTLMDEANTPVTGEITTSLVSYNPADPSAIALLSPDPSDGREEAAGKLNTVKVLVAAGSYQAKSSSGKKVEYKTAPQGQTITLSLGIESTATINPATGLSWKVGDKAPVEFKPSNGTWRTIGEFIVVSKSGKLSFEYKNRSMYTGEYKSTVAQQTVPIVVNVTRNGQGGTIDVQVEQFGFVQSGQIRAGRSSITFGKVPTPSPSRRVSVMYGAGEGMSVAAANGTTFTLSLPDPRQEVTVTVTPTCPAGQGLYLSNLPSVFISARENTRPNSFSLGDISKQAIINRAGNVPTGAITAVIFRTRQFEVGKTYVLTGVYEGETFTETRTVSGTALTFPWDVSQLCR